MGVCSKRDFRTRVTLLALCAALFALGAPITHAQGATVNYPAKPLRFMIGFGPGGSTDQMTRRNAIIDARRIGRQ